MKVDSSQRCILFLNKNKHILSYLSILSKRFIPMTCNYSPSKLAILKKTYHTKHSLILKGPSMYPNLKIRKISHTI